MARNPKTDAVVHVRYAGVSHDLPLDDLGLTYDASDVVVKASVARYLDLKASDLDAYVVERHPTGNLTVRPEAIFG